jgi:ubiquinone biosynthesis protein UbiJ
VRREAHTTMKVVAHAVGEAMIEGERVRQTAEDELKAEIAALPAEVEQLRERVDKLEAAPSTERTLRAVS